MAARTAPLNVLGIKASRHQASNMPIAVQRHGTMKKQAAGKGLVTRVALRQPLWSSDNGASCTFARLFSPCTAARQRRCSVWLSNAQKQDCINCQHLPLF